MGHYAEPEPDDLGDVSLLLGAAWVIGILAFIGWMVL